MKPILVLRPEPAATATAESARALGLEPVVAPLFEVQPVAWATPDPARFDALLLTSANAIRIGGNQLQALRRLPVHAVGDRTAEAARDAGFDVASSGDAGLDRLLDSLEPDLRLLHPCGENRHEAQEPRQKITPLIVYRSTARDDVDLSAAEGSVALVHSPRAARRLSELVENRSSVEIAAISSVAAGAAGPGWARVEAAERPTDEALLALAARLCNKPPPE